MIQIEWACKSCDILLSSSEDRLLLGGTSSSESALELLANGNIDEIMLINGPNEIPGYDRGRLCQIQPLKAARVVDTTSVGDAFHAGYIVARHAGFATEEPGAKASSLASVVISLPGAIIPKSRMLPI